MSYQKRCNFKTKQASLQGDRKPNLPSVGIALKMWKAFLVIFPNLPPAGGIEEETSTGWSGITVSSGKKYQLTFKKDTGKCGSEKGRLC